MDRHSPEWPPKSKKSLPLRKGLLRSGGHSGEWRSNVSDYRASKASPNSTAFPVRRDSSAANTMAWLCKEA